MNYLLKNCLKFTEPFVRIEKGDFLIKGSDGVEQTDITLNENCLVVPGFVDAHVHLREPGFSYKETIRSGTLSAAKGGFTTVFSMPNLNPAPDCFMNLQEQLEIIDKDSAINVVPIGCISVKRDGKEISDMVGLSRYVAGFSDDGNGIQDDSFMEKAMLVAKSLNKPIIAHCEDASQLTKGGSINKCDYADKVGLIGINSESEWRQVERDVGLVKKTGCPYHVCHVSTKESVEIIRIAKQKGLPVTAETAPHYLVLNDGMLIDDGRFKMNPPIRGEEDRIALVRGLLDGTIDIIATDHAPHSAEEKDKGLEGSLMGISGLETAFPILYTRLVLGGDLTLVELIRLMSLNPRKIFQMPFEKDFTVIDLSSKYTIDSTRFASMGKATPFDKASVQGRIIMTFVSGKMVYGDLKNQVCQPRTVSI